MIWNQADKSEGEKKTESSRVDYSLLTEQKPEVLEAKFSNPGWLMHSEGLTPQAEGHHVNFIICVGVMF